MRSLAFLFPGQGSQRVDMLRELPQTPSVRATIADARRHLHLLGLSADIDTEQALRNTTSVQLALLISGTACARALIDEQHLRPQFVLGHSVGAFAAAVTAEVLTFEEAIRAVNLRGQSMIAACADRPWAMAALDGLSLLQAQQLVTIVCTPQEPLWIANINTATQVVLAGTRAALSRAKTAARQAGARKLELLDVAVVSHCPVQTATVALLADHLAAIPRRAPTARYLTNTTGRAVSTADAVLTDLAEAVAQPVRWFDAARLVGELGATCAIQMSPGDVVSKLMRTATPGISVQTVDGIGIQQAAARARRCLGR